MSPGSGPYSLRRALNIVAEQAGLTAEDRAILETGHRYNCRCGTCLKWWRMTGPDPETHRYGPFTAEEIGNVDAK